MTNSKEVPVGSIFGDECFYVNGKKGSPNEEGEPVLIRRRIKILRAIDLPGRETKQSFEEFMSGRIKYVDLPG
ncbi:unnamed protein product [Allacma fusca]|uniref:Uncharacterized protein n=1 Tax=Allacma fusca TaxID=39272 RepID=A0A8J2KFV8_9HEXA|nr:unnamed protein product [Allacma fusca]